VPLGGPASLGSSSDDRTISGEPTPAPWCRVTTVPWLFVCSNSAEGRDGKIDSLLVSGLALVGNPSTDGLGAEGCVGVGGCGECALGPIELGLDMPWKLFALERRPRGVCGSLSSVGSSPHCCWTAAK
jgi:hypothetical protein